MRRPDVLLTSRREEARTECKRPRHGSERFYVEGELDNWLFMCPAHHGSAPAVEDRELSPASQPVDPPSAKVLYLQTMQQLLRDRFQSTWGRVQQTGEMDFEPFVELAAALRRIRRRMAGSIRTVLEEFDGFVDLIDKDVAHVTLKARDGEILYGEYPAAELKAKGIYEGRRFKCRTIEAGSGIQLDLEAVPDREISEEREREIDEMLRKSLGDDDAPQDDY